MILKTDVFGRFLKVLVWGDCMIKDNTKDEIIMELKEEMKIWQEVSMESLFALNKKYNI
ncbi:MAG: hypothetical protein AABW80_04570 [Nanoarchaeota archaeon]